MTGTVIAMTPCSPANCTGGGLKAIAKQKSYAPVGYRTPVVQPVA